MKRSILGLLALLVAGSAFGQEPAQYNHKPDGPYPRGRKAPTPMLQATMLANHPEQDFPKITLPAYDSRADGKLTPPFRNQANCGSCWDFSGIRTIAYARMKAGLNPFQLSEQYVLDCVQSGGCNGDDNTTVLKAAKQKGIPADSDYTPYHASEGRCSSDGKQLHTIDDWVFVDGDAGYDRVGNTQKIKNAIYATGAVGCAVAATSTWDGYSGGVHRGHSRQIDHDVVLTGWVDDATLSEGGYWLMDNSWSEKWGIGGRMKIAYGADSIGTEPVAVVLAQPAPPPPPTPPVPPTPGPCPHFMGVHVGLWTLVIGLVVGGLVVFFVMRKKA